MLKIYQLALLNYRRPPAFHAAFAPAKFIYVAIKIFEAFHLKT